MDIESERAPAAGFLRAYRDAASRPRNSKVRSESNSGKLICNMCRIVRTARVSRKWISAIGLFAFLFAQISLAGYVCPGLSEGKHTGARTEQAMGPCAEMDAQQPSVCHEHCKDQAGVDHVPLPGVPSSMAMAPSLVIAHFDAHRAVLPTSCAGPDPTRVTRPPSSILFCVFRT